MYTWDIIDNRPIPQWFGNAKFGIFIHWGIYSVPAWAPKKTYAEWYGWTMQDRNSEIWDFHKAVYGEQFKYQDFAPKFKAELFDADKWAELFKKSGARYVVLTSKHHDGFCLWPSPQSWNWNSYDIGPHRDIVGELTEAVRKQKIKMGLYYSLMEWYRPLYLKDPSRYAVEHMIPQMKDLVETYHPDLLFTDGEWDYSSDIWHSKEFLFWLFNESSVKDQVVINDRWGKETRSRHGGYYTTEYGEVTVGVTLDYENVAKIRQWEECRGIGASFGYNRNEDLEDYMSAADVIHLLVDTVSKGGNLLLNIGPAADGTIPVIMEERLLEVGNWLKVNGEAIYDTEPWVYNPKDGDIRYTSNKEHLYAICYRWPDKDLILDIPGLDSQNFEVSLLGYSGHLSSIVNENGKLQIKASSVPINSLSLQHAYVFKITNAYS